MIYVPHEVVRDEKLSNDDILAYVFTQIQTYSENYDSCILRVADVVDQAFGECNSHKINAKISRSIKKLIDTGNLDVMTEKSKVHRIFMSSFQPSSEGGFVKVAANEMRDIVDNVPRYKSDVLRCYLLILSSLNQTNTGIFERSWFAEIMDVGEDSVTRCFQVLEDQKKIYVYRAPTDFYISNTYGLYEHKESVIRVGQQRSKSRKVNNKANEKRRYVSMYYSFLDGKEYPTDTLEKILEFMEKRNKEITDLGVRARGKTYDLTPLIDKINAQ